MLYKYFFGSCGWPKDRKNCLGGWNFSAVQEETAKFVHHTPDASSLKQKEGFCMLNT